MRSNLIRRASRWSPRFEMLEDRSTPSATAVLVGGVLTITGDAASDDVAIRAVGTDSFSVTKFDNINPTPTTQTFNSVTSIVANLGEGDNNLSLDATLDTNVSLSVTTGAGQDYLNVGVDGVVAPSATLNVTADLGAGNDKLRFVSSGLAANANLNLNVKLGTDNDRATVVLGAIGTRATARVNLDLGADTDSLGLSAIRGLATDALLNLKVNAGAGSDTVRLQLGDIGTVAAPATALLNLNLGDGNDLLLLQVGEIGMDSDLNVRIDGGAGNDAMGLKFVGNIDRNANIGLNINQGAGDDRLGVTINPPSSIITVDLSASIFLTLVGGAGLDRATFDLQAGADAIFSSYIDDSVEILTGLSRSA